LAGIAVGFWFSFLLPRASISHLRQLAFFAGIILMLTGIALRQYSMKVLGQFFTFDVAIHAGHSLVELGPYRYIRHPSYSGGLITMFGFGLALGNWAALVFALLALAIAYTYRISVEEAALVTALGDSYKQYVSRTWRLIPFLF
jgi:protein-S-isoprenylcysteine O-methyltransferase Ste14